MMKPELDCEYSEPDETELTKEMDQLIRDRMEKVAKGEGGCMQRGQHAKATGCVRALFEIQDNLADYLRHGVFKQPQRAFQAIVRFSNSSEKEEDDAEEAARGMAIKLLDVDGSNRCQDFLMVNHPVFPFATPAEYVKFFDIRDKGVVGEQLAPLWLGATHLRHLLIAKKIREKKVANPLRVRYWSGSPYWLGPVGIVGGRAVKYSVMPRLEETEPRKIPDDDPENYLSHALKQHLKARNAIFDFRIQPQTDAEAMPVEDATIEWPESLSMPVPVATLTIGVQDLDSPEGIALHEQCEAMAFSPWNALDEHRPMGGINRLRKAVYLVSQEMRAQKRIS